MTLGGDTGVASSYGTQLTIASTQVHAPLFTEWPIMMSIEKIEVALD